MRTKVGVMGSAAEIEPGQRVELESKLTQLCTALAANDVVLFTGATTGLMREVGKAARTAGVFHVGSKFAGRTRLTLWASE